MSSKLRMTHSTALVLQALARGNGYGFEVMEITGLGGGTVYPALRRLEGAGLVDSRWEDQRLARGTGRPPRKYYRLTSLGERVLQEAAARYRVLGHIAGRTAEEG